MTTETTMTAHSLAHCAQVAHGAEVERVVGDGTYLTTGEAAEVIGVSKSTVIKLIRVQLLSATNVPGSTHKRILRSEAERFRDEMRRQARGESS